MKLIRQVSNTTKYKEWEICIPFTKNKWIEILLENNVWLDISFKEIYKVKPEYQKILGKTDSRTFFELAVHNSI